MDDGLTKQMVNWLVYRDVAQYLRILGLRSLSIFTISKEVSEVQRSLMAMLMRLSVLLISSDIIHINGNYVYVVEEVLDHKSHTNTYKSSF